MFETIIFIIGPIVAFFAGYIYRETLLLKDLVNVSNKLNQEISKEIKKSVPNNSDLVVKDIKHLKHEIIDDIHYFFVEKDNTFACQGKTLTEAAINYTFAQGKDILGHFTHFDQNKNYCFVNNQCLEFINE